MLIVIQVKALPPYMCASYQDPRTCFPVIFLSPENIRCGRLNVLETSIVLEWGDLSTALLAAENIIILCCKRKTQRLVIQMQHD